MRGLTDVESEKAHALDQVCALEGNHFPVSSNPNVNYHFSCSKDIECPVGMVGVGKGAMKGTLDMTARFCPR